MNTCKNCGIVLNNKNKYCSYTCRNVYVNTHIRDYKKNGKSLSDRAKISYQRNPKICPSCGDNISYNNRENKYCSDECRSKELIKWNNSRKGEKRNFSEKGLKNITLAKNIRFNIGEYYLTPKYCKQCGNPLSFGKRNYIFCNINCRKLYDKRNMSEYQKYYRECQFNFALNDFPDEFEFTLIEEYGWYQAKNHGDNLNGVSRDHMISVKYGYENNMNSEIISHPANCKLMIHNDNVRKYKTCSITINELNERINIWNTKYAPQNN